MDGTRVWLMAAVLTDIHSASRDAASRRCEFIADQLDTIAEFGGSLPDLKDRLSACVNALRLRWRPPAREHLGANRSLTQWRRHITQVARDEQRDRVAPALGLKRDA